MSAPVVAIPARTWTLSAQFRGVGSCTLQHEGVDSCSPGKPNRFWGHPERSSRDICMSASSAKRGNINRSAAFKHSMARNGVVQ